MTPDEKKRVEEIRGREEKATAGPWQSDLDIYEEDCEIEAGVFDADIDMLFTAEVGLNTRGKNSEGLWAEAEKTQGKRDADFIAAARSDIPFLLSLVSRLEVRVGELTGEMERASGELRHAWKGSALGAAAKPNNWREFDGNLITKAVGILERALSTDTGEET